MIYSALIDMIEFQSYSMEGFFYTHDNLKRQEKQLTFKLWNVTNVIDNRIIGNLIIVISWGESKCQTVIQALIQGLLKVLVKSSLKGIYKSRTENDMWECKYNNWACL